MYSFSLRAQIIPFKIIAENRLLTSNHLDKLSVLIKRVNGTESVLSIYPLVYTRFSIIEDVC